MPDTLNESIPPPFLKEDVGSQLPGDSSARPNPDLQTFVFGPRDASLDTESFKNTPLSKGGSFITSAYGGRLPNPEESRAAALDYIRSMPDLKISEKPLSDIESAYRKMADLRRGGDNSPEAISEKEKIAAYAKYLSPKEGITREQELRAPIEEAFNYARKGFQESTGVGIPGGVDKVDELLKSHPVLTRDQVENSMGFGKRLLVSILGGIGGHPNMVNEFIDRKISDNERDLKAGLDRLLTKQRIGADEMALAISAAGSKNQLDMGSLEAAIKIAEAKKAEALAPEEKYKYDIMAAQAQDAKNRLSIENKKMDAAKQQMFQTMQFEIANNPLAIKTSAVDSEGNPVSVIANSEKDKEFLTDFIPKYEFIFGKDGPVNRFVAALNKERGYTDWSKQEKVNTLNQIMQSMPEFLKVEAQKKGWFDTAENLTDREMLQRVMDLNRFGYITIGTRSKKPSLSNDAQRSILKQNRVIK